MQGNYVPNWHHEVIARELENVASGQCKRLMLFMPPRHGKTELATIKFPAWFLGKHPDKEIICASHTADLAEDFGRKTRDTVDTDIHRAVFPKCVLRKGSKSASKWRVSDRGGFRAAGVGGAIVGMGADVLLIDDPIKNYEEADSFTYRKRVWDWYASTAFTRLEKGGAVILIMQRWHDDDLAGRLLELEGEYGYSLDKNTGKWVKGVGLGKPGKWKVVRFPAIATEDERFRKKGEALWTAKYDLEALEEIKILEGYRGWGALYQQDPVVEEGAEFRKEWFKRWTELPKGVRYITTVDLAISQKTSADDSVVMTVATDGHDNIYVVEYKNWKANPSDVIDEIYRQHELYNSYVGVESVGYQQSIFHYLRLAGQKRGKYLHIEEIRTNSNKESKIRGLIPFYSNGMIYHANGMQELEEQLVRFPSGKHDDIIDALAMSLGLLRRPAIMGREKEDLAVSVGLKYGLDGKPYI